MDLTLIVVEISVIFSFIIYYHCYSSQSSEILLYWPIISIRQTVSADITLPKVSK